MKSRVHSNMGQGGTQPIGKLQSYRNPRHPLESPRQLRPAMQEHIHFDAVVLPGNHLLNSMDAPRLKRINRTDAPSTCRASLKRHHQDCWVRLTFCLLSNRAWKEVLFSGQNSQIQLVFKQILALPRCPSLIYLLSLLGASWQAEKF